MKRWIVSFTLAIFILVGSLAFADLVQHQSTASVPCTDNFVSISSAEAQAYRMARSNVPSNAKNVSWPSYAVTHNPPSATVDCTVTYDLDE